MQVRYDSGDRQAVSARNKISGIPSLRTETPSPPHRISVVHVAPCNEGDYSGEAIDSICRSTSRARHRSVTLNSGIGWCTIALREVLCLAPLDSVDFGNDLLFGFITGLAILSYGSYHCLRTPILCRYFYSQASPSNKSA